MANFTPTGVTFVAQGLNQYLGNLGKADKAQQNLGKSASGLTGVFSSLGSGITSVGLAAGTAAVAGIAALGAGLVTIGTKGVTAAANLEQSMVNIASVMGKTKDEVTPLKDEILALSLNPKLVVTATEAAQAVELLARNGITMTEILDGAAGSVVALANATGADFGVAADVATDAMVQFGVSAENMESAIDGITGVTTNSKLDINDYALAISSAGGIAAGMGVSLADLNTGLAGTASFFSTGRVAGTSFKTFLQRLANPTDEMNMLLDELGLSLFDNEGNMRALGDVAGQLNQAFEGLTDQQKAQIATQLGGADAARTVLALAEFTTEEFNALSLEVNKTGQAFQAAATRTDSLKGRMEILKSIIQGVSIQIGDKFLPGVTKTADLMINLANKVGPSVVKFFGKLATTLSKITAPINDIIFTVSDLITTFQAGGLFGKRFGSFGSEGLLSALGIPPDIQDILQNAILTFQNFQTELFDLIDRFQSGDSGGLLLTIFGTDGLTTIGATLITQAQTILESLITSIVSFATSQAQTIQTAFFEMIGVNSIEQAFGLMLANIPVVLQNIVNAITGFVIGQAPTILTTLGEWANTFIMWIDNAVNLLSQNLGAILVAIATWAGSGEAQSKLLALGTGLGQNLVAGLEILFTDGAKIIGVMTKLVLALAAGALALTGILIAVGAQLVAGILAGIINSLGGNLQPATISELQTILPQIGRDALLAAKVIGLNIILGIIGGIEEGIEDLRTTVSQIGTIITTTVSEQLGIQSPSTVFFGFGMNIVQGLIDGITSLGGSLLETIGGLFSFGEEGEGEGEMNMDFLPNLESMTLMQENLALLQEQFMMFFELVNVGLMNITIATSAFNELLLLLYVSTLPILNTTAMMFFTSYMSQMTMIIGATMRLIQTVLQLKVIIASSTKDMIAKFKDTQSSIESLIETIKVDFIKAIEEAITKVNNWITAMKEAAATRAALRAAKGSGEASKGLGFASGTGPLGFLVPPGFPNDSFPINVESGERVLVAPRGRSIESIVGSGDRQQIININATVNNGMDEQVLIERIRRVTAQGLG